VFEEILGLPLHPLAVHVPIVLVPALALVSVAYALLPRFRAQLEWLAALLAVAAPVSAYVAKLAGEALRDNRVEPNASAGILAGINDHANLGNRLVWAAIGLGVLTLLLIGVRRMRGANWLSWGLAGLVVIAAVLAAIAIFQVGDSGANMVWKDRWPG
jgi:uncharacterized membrane protein